MRIIHITYSLCNGGKENLLIDIANEQVNSNNKISVIIINNSYDENIVNRISNQIEIIYLKRNKGIKDIFKLLRLFFLLKVKLHPDVIHCHDIYLGKHLIFIARRKKVVTIHGLGFPTEPLRFFNKIFAISEIVKKDIENRSSFKCIVIHNGINTRNIKIRSKVGLGETINLVQVSNLIHKFKGQDILLKAMNILINERCVKNLQLDLVGEGASRILLEQMIRDFKLDAYVNLLGSKSRNWVYENLCIYDIFIQASRNEGFGLTVAEAMAANLPVIASMQDGPAEVLGYGKYGILFENENSVDLANKIVEVIKAYENGSIYQITQLAYQYCKASYEIAQTSQNYLNCYY